MTLKEWFQTRICIKKKPVEEDEIVEIDVIGEIEETDKIVQKVRFEEEKKEEKKNDEKRPTSYGSFIRIRDTLDYTYHSSYPEERQWFQDSITETILGDVDSPETTPSEPWLIYLAGSLCSGKNEILQKIEDKGNLPLLSYIFIDTEDIQQRMPENSIFIKSISNEAQSRFRKEAKLISEITETAAMEKGKNVVISCSPLTHTWFSKRISVIREKYPQYKIAIIHVTISLSNALHENAMNTTENKSVSPRLIEQMVKEIPLVVSQLEPLVDCSFEIQKEDDFKLLPDNDWELFQVNWMQTPKSAIRQTQFDHKRASVAALMASPPQRLEAIRFSAQLSTEQNYKKTDKQFYGSYAEIRSTLDYNYHDNYTKQRQLLQDKIISSFIGNILIQDKNGELCTTPTEPFIVFTAGAMGAGKGHTIKTLVDRGHFPLLAFVVVDPDEIRRHFPEYQLYVNECPEKAGELTRKEAGFVAEILTAVALEQGKNVLVDGSLRDSVWYGEYFQQLRDRYPQLKLAIIHVTAPRETIFRRAEERGIKTGRVVPMETMIMAIEQVPRSVEILQKLVDIFVEIDNPDDSDIVITSSEMDWDMFKSIWLQTCAYRPKRNIISKWQSTRF